MKHVRTLVLLAATCCVPLLGVSAASGLDPSEGVQPPRPSRPEKRRNPPVVERCTDAAAEHARPAAAIVPAPEPAGMCGASAALPPSLQRPVPRVEVPAPATDDARRAYRRWEQARGPTAWQRQRARDVARVRAVGRYGEE